MKIALVSYEYPPDTAYGGIATYKAHAARMLRDRGHDVEVFAASPTRCGETEQDGVIVHRVQETERTQFPHKIAPIFAARHDLVKFDVVEAPEYYADASGIMKLVADVPVVVKLHTPSYMLWRMTFGHSKWELARNAISAAKRGELPSWMPKRGVEYSCTRQADEVAAPCKAIGDEVTRDWQLDPSRVMVVPNVYDANRALLQIDPNTRNRVVSFMGRLETRKGVVDLANAIPLVLAEEPDVMFRFVGRSVELRPGHEMVDHLRLRLHAHLKQVDFAGPLPLDQMPQAFAQTDICVFPSIWENFPNVCLEAMSAARGVVGSRAGGMSEMIEDGKSGLLVSPRKPRELADAILRLVRDPNFRIQCGIRARERVLLQFGRDRVGQLQEESYKRAIHHRQQVGPRSVERGAVAV